MAKSPEMTMNSDRVRRQSDKEAQRRTSTSLRWLREHPPLPVPEIPAPDVTALAATGGLNGLSKASVSRLAWSAADEWRRLAEVRSELERCRDQLAEHQAVLLHVGDAIHTEVDRLQDGLSLPAVRATARQASCPAEEWERNVKMREDELGSRGYSSMLTSLLLPFLLCVDATYSDRRC
eukprot:s2120_g7.t1